MPPTFDNTIIALERSGVLLTRVTKIFFAIVSANTNDTLQKVQEEVAPRLAAHNDAIRLNTSLFKRIDTVYRQRDSLHLDGTQRFLIQRYYKDFVRSGVLLSDAEKSRLRTLNIEESKLTTSFQEHLLAATKAGALVVQDRHELDGLSDAEISAAAEAAHQRGMDGMWVLSLQNTTQQPSQASLHNRTVRERLFIASTTRTEKQDSNDTRRNILRLAGIRVEKARLLGYPNYAATSLPTTWQRLHRP